MVVCVGEKMCKTEKVIAASSGRYSRLWSVDVPPVQIYIRRFDNEDVDCGTLLKDYEIFLHPWENRRFQRYRDHDRYLYNGNSNSSTLFKRHPPVPRVDLWKSIIYFEKHLALLGAFLKILIFKSPLYGAPLQSAVAKIKYEF